MWSLSPVQFWGEMGRVGLSHLLVGDRRVAGQDAIEQQIQPGFVELGGQHDDDHQ